MKMLLKVRSSALVLIPAAMLLSQVSKWPVIQPLEEKRVFISPGQNNTDTPFLAFIKNNDGFPIYKLNATTETMKTSRR
jgi:hypothetical protein